MSFVIILGPDYHARSEFAQALAHAHGDRLDVIDLDHNSEEKKVLERVYFLEFPELKPRIPALTLHLNELHRKKESRHTITILNGFCRTNLEWAHLRDDVCHGRSFFVMLKTDTERAYERHLRARADAQRSPNTKRDLLRLLEIHCAQQRDVCRAIRHTRIPIHVIDFERGTGHACQTLVHLVDTKTGINHNPNLCDVGLGLADSAATPQPAFA